jgi:hypothetical protein
MNSRPNNPRAFAEVVSIDVWRTAFEGGKAEADLHIDAGFFQGRVGENEVKKSPVRFRMSLKRAEIHVFRDHGNVIEIPPASVVREAPVASRAKTTMTQSGSMKGGLKAGFAGMNPSLNADLEAQASVELTKRIEKDEEVGHMRIGHRRMPDNSGYVFTIESASASTLDGPAWDPSIARMKIRDTNTARKRGDPPEVTVQIRCRREDLHIEDIIIIDANVWNGGHLSKNKKLAVEQYIKKEILSAGMACGDLSDPFTTIILADAVSWLVE